MPAAKVTLTVKVDRTLRTEIRKKAVLAGMKMGPLIEQLLRNAITFNAVVSGEPISIPPIEGRS